MTFETSRRAALTLAIVVTIGVGLAAPSAAGSGQASQAHITLTFADQCRDFTAHSSKDISHVELHFVDGRVAKDETTTSPDYVVDGSIGDELASAVVKSGTTTQTFPCTQSNSPPTAHLEIKVPTCDPDGFGSPPYVLCYAIDERAVWLRPSGDSEGHIQIGASAAYDDFVSQLTWSFRGIGSTDPDGDITSWTIDFGDGTTIFGGSWTTQPPIEILHHFEVSVGTWAPTVTLTVTDSAGNSDSDTLTILFFDITPD